MSTFNGKFSDDRFKDICIDNFLPNNYDCKSFFLSHFHSDHMKGIWEPTFHSQFEKKGVRFYCSEITKQFILRSCDIKIPSYKIKVIDKDGSDIRIDEDVWIQAWALPAGHCPGSIMLLFEGFGLRVLYTGDFRMPLSDLWQLEALHSCEGELLSLDDLYLDTTFAQSDFKSFPTRQESLKIIKEAIDDWLKKDRQNRIVIISSACIGIEYLMVELCQAYSSKVHVSTNAYERFLSGIDLLRQVVTTEPENTKIHFCNVRKCDTCFRRIFDRDYLLLIKPSALYFTQGVQKENGIHFHDPRTKFLRVAYSSHSSCNELVEFVNYLKPKRIHPCVVPPGDAQQFFEQFLKLCSRKRPLPDVSHKIEEDHLSFMDVYKTFVQQSCLKLVTVLDEDKSQLIRLLEVETPPY